MSAEPPDPAVAPVPGSPSLPPAPRDPCVAAAPAESPGLAEVAGPAAPAAEAAWLLARAPLAGAGVALAGRLAWRPLAPEAAMAEPLTISIDATTNTVSAAAVAAGAPHFRYRASRPFPIICIGITSVRPRMWCAVSKQCACHATRRVKGMSRILLSWRGFKSPGPIRRTDMQDPFRPSRRRLLKAIGATVPASAAVLAGAQGSTPGAAAAHGAASAAQPAGAAPGAALENPVALFFNADERITVDAIVARLIPADELGPGAKEAGVTTFLDRQLGGAYGAGAHFYRQGPFQPGTPEQGYQLPLTPAECYRLGRARPCMRDAIRWEALCPAGRRHAGRGA